MPKLTKRFVDKLAIKPTDYIVFDADVGGFAVRVFPSGRKSYLIQYRSGGRTRRLAIGKHGTVATDEARKEALRRLGEVAKGEDPSHARNQRLRAPSMAELCERYLTEHAQAHCKPNTLRNYRGLIKNHIQPRLGMFKAVDIRRSDIAEFHHSMRETPHQANRALATLSKMFNLAELWGIRPDGSNPVRLVPKYKEKPKERYLSHVELMRLGQVFFDAVYSGAESPFVVAAYQLLLMTGCRMSEIMTLKWEYVTATHLELPDSKTGKRRIPFSADAHAVLASLPRTLGNPYVIEGKLPNTHCADLQHAWQRLRKTAGLEDVRIHDLRHTYASMAVTNGIDLLTVGKILGHSNYQTTERYAHLADEAVRNASDRVSGMIAGAISPVRNDTPTKLRVVT
ncbi:MAG: tyrosine-type recombinase/integrase [Rhodobacteraceae bacterium]|nr:tyrosine-type recombinase/integrase [Paracoccaceae bacterium]